MGRIVRELKSFPGMILGMTIALIVTFWALNLVQSRTPAPINAFGGRVFSLASGQAYGGAIGAPAAPAMVTSPYTYSSNGPLI